MSARPGGYSSLVIDAAICLVLTIVVLAYLSYAMLRPERF